MEFWFSILTYFGIIGQIGRPYPSAALYPQGNSLVLVYVRG